MQTEELRAQLLRFLATWNFQANQGLRWDDCRKGVSRQIASDSRGRLAPEWEMPREDMVRLKAIVWDLIIGRVLSPGWINNSDSGWPMLSLTDHGEKVIKGTHPVPYDPDGYLARLLKVTGGLSRVSSSLSGGITLNFQDLKLPGLRRDAGRRLGDALPRTLQGDLGGHPGIRSTPRASRSGPASRSTWRTGLRPSRSGSPTNNRRYRRIGRIAIDCSLSTRSRTSSGIGGTRPGIPRNRRLHGRTMRCTL